MKRTARTTLLVIALIMSISILPAKQVRADSDTTAAKFKEVEISGSGYIGAASDGTSDGGEDPDGSEDPEDGENPDDGEDPDGIPAGSGGNGDSSGQRKAAGIATPVTGDQSSLFLYLAVLSASAAVIFLIHRKRWRVSRIK